MIELLQMVIDTNNFGVCVLEDPFFFFKFICHSVRIMFFAILSVKCGVQFSGSRGNVFCRNLYSSSGVGFA